MKRRIHAIKLIETNPKRVWVAAAVIILVAAGVNVFPWHVIAQESRPARPVPARRPAADNRFTGAGVQAEPAEGRRARPGNDVMRSRTFGGGSPAVGVPSRFGSPPPGPPPDVAPARFEATVYQLQVPEDRVAALDAQSLKAQAGTAQSLAKALAEFGQTKVLYKVDQTVNLYGEGISLGTSEPMVTGTRATGSGQFINTVNYMEVGLVINITSRPPPPETDRKGLDTQVNFHLSVLGDSGVELEPKVKAPCVSNIE